MLLALFSMCISAQTGLFFESNVELESRFRLLTPVDRTEYTSFYLDDRMNDIPKMRVGLNIKLGYTISQRWAVLLGISYTNLGYYVNSESIRYPNDHDGNGSFIIKENYRQQSDLQAITVPLELRYHVINKDKYRLFASLGVNTSYLYNTILSEVFDNNNQEVVRNYDIDNAGITPLLFGGTAGLGLELPTSESTSMMVKGAIDYYFSTFQTLVLEEQLVGGVLDVGFKKSF